MSEEATKGRALTGSPASVVRLSSPDSVRDIYERVYIRRLKTNKELQKWHSSHVTFLEDLQGASPAELTNVEFQKRIWEQNPISSSGACSVSMEKVIEDQELSQWLVDVSQRPLPPRGPERLAKLEEVLAELSQRVGRLTDRMPWLKILRVMASFFPKDFSCVTTKSMLRRVAEAMFGKLPKEERESPVHLNARILQHLEEVLGPPGESLDELAVRGKFVWCLWQVLSGAQDEQDDTTPLPLLPAERRLKGIGAMGDPLNMILDVVEFVSQNRPSRDATVDFIKDRQPTLKRVSASQYLNSVWNTFGMLRLDGNAFELTQQGQRFLDSQDPDELIRPLVIKSIGPDLVLWMLAQQGPTFRSDLVQALKYHYPAWTTDFMPNTLLRYGRLFDLWRTGDDGRYLLTDRGQRWARRIPKKPPRVTTEESEDTDVDEQLTVAPKPFRQPSLADIVAYFRSSPLVFPEKLVLRLHAALHAAEAKHFVLLSGLSGTGKTQLALTYANAYHGIDAGQHNPFLLLVSVQPDWTDPTGLLGYVNPLGGEISYVRTRCMRFLLSAHEKPGIPHFLCLDEMNLARVEYYFAPFLSAMETGGSIVLHEEKENIDGAPPSIPWPRNLFIFGTVNMDETTYAFSDKVLDRAFTIEFWDVDLPEFTKRFRQSDQGKAYPGPLLEYAMSRLDEAKRVLARTHQHFGYRTVAEVLGYLGASGGSIERQEAMDQAVFMKVLPKLRGQDTDAIRQTLTDLRRWCSDQGFVVSEAKLSAMDEELRATGTMRFWR